MNLQILENLAHKLSQNVGQETSIRISRDIGPFFFNDTRLATIIATAAQSAPLTVVDWHDSWDETGIQRFSNSIDGIASIVHAQKLKNVKGVYYPNKSDEVLRAIIDNFNVLESIRDYWNSFTVCAFDPESPNTVRFSLLETKDQFVKDFKKMRQFWLERSITSEYSFLIDEHADDSLAGFIHEIWQNSFDHGRLDENGNIIPGFRYVRINKHLHHVKKHFLDKCQNFPELREYMENTIKGDGEFTFFETTVSDHGLGVLEHFLIARPEYVSQASTYGEQRRLLHRIFSEGLTSKSNTKGAGYGLDRAMQAASKLRAFVSVRTDRFWLCGTSTDRSAPIKLAPVSEQVRLSRLAGTQFNILVPMVVDP